MERWDIINKLIKRSRYSSYLEIGVRRGTNFSKISCRKKIGVDPDPKSKATLHVTSDQFFSENKKMFDIIFIDGLHTEKQVDKDITNSLAALRDGGTIVVHDCSPRTEFEAREEYKTKKYYKRGQYKPECGGSWAKKCKQSEFGHYPPWNGTVWRSWVKLRSSRSDLHMYVVDTDSGCGVISRGEQETIKIPSNFTFEILKNKRNQTLNLVKVDEFRQYIKKVLQV